MTGRELSEYRFDRKSCATLTFLWILFLAFRAEIVRILGRLVGTENTEEFAQSGQRDKENL